MVTDTSGFTPEQVKEVMNTLLSDDFVEQTRDKSLNEWSLSQRNTALYNIMRMMAPMYAHEVYNISVTNTDFGISFDVLIKPDTNSRVIMVIADPLHFFSKEDANCKNNLAMNALIQLCEKVLQGTIGLANVTTDTESLMIIED